MDSLKELCERLEALERHVRRAEQRARVWRNIACCLIIVGLVGLPVPTSTARENSSSKENRGLAHRVEKLEDIFKKLVRSVKAIEHKLIHITSSYDEVVITGANLRIVNGLGSTETTNGLGNLIVGYNESRNNPIRPDVRTGSHNIVGGWKNDFSSYGGLVVGMANEISGPFASVSGGNANAASGVLASVSGGQSNGASGVLASVSGGDSNAASGFAASVSGGGERNTASGFFASVSGGFGNTASGDDASISGGSQSTASGFAASVTGGRFNTASGDFSSVSGGLQRTAPGQNNWAAGPLFADN